MALTAAIVVGGTIGWLLRGGSSNGAEPSATTSVGSSVSAEGASVEPSASSPSPTTEVSTPIDSVGSAGPSAPLISGSPGTSVVVTAGAVTVTATPSSAGKFEPIEISGSATGVTPGTTLEFTRQGGDTLATTQVGRAGAYRLTVKLGRQRHVRRAGGGRPHGARVLGALHSHGALRGSLSSSAKVRLT